jgi:hypothetical protein
MTVIGITVLALFALSVIGVATVVLHDQPDETGGTEDGHDEHQRDAAWIAELHALNDAMPYVRRHRARQARKARAL